MNILDKVKAAQKALRSTQSNWAEDCLFDCDNMLSAIIAELEAESKLPSVEVSADGNVSVKWEAK